MAEAGFSHVNAILTRQMNRLHRQNRGDLRLKLTNFQPIQYDSCYFVKAKCVFKHYMTNTSKFSSVANIHNLTTLFGHYKAKNVLCRVNINGWIS